MDPENNNQQQGSQKLFMDLSGRGGLAARWFGDEGDTIAQFPQYRYIGDQDQNPTYSYKSSTSQFAAGVYSPTRRFGYMCPSPASFTTITEDSGPSDFTNEWRTTIYDPFVDSYFAGENGPLLWGGSSGSTAMTLSLSSAIAGTNVKLTDLELYQVNGTRKLFFSYQETGSGGNIGILQTDTGGTIISNNNTWLHSTAAGGFYLGSTNDHFMVVADNGYMYVGDGNAVHKIDGTLLTGGTNGTATQNVLVAPPNFIFLDGVDHKGSLWLAIEDTPLAFSNTAAFSGNKCGVYVWDRQTTIVNMTDYIPLYGVKNIKKIYVTQQGTVRVICMSSKRTTQIREFDGSVFQIVDEDAMVSYPTYRDSVAIAGSMVNWLGTDARIYGNGIIAEGENEQTYIVGDASGVQATGSFTAGAIIFIWSNASTTVSKTAIVLSIKDSTPAVYNRIWFPNGITATPSTGNVFTLVKYFPYPVKINYVRVYHNTGATSGATQQGTLSVFLNQATSANKTFAITRDDISKGYKYCPINQGLKGVVTSIQAGIQWSAVTTADATDWMPRMLEVDYEPIARLL